ncbi:MAG: hypothetical protein QM820_20775 [Minicystis sp.]
MSARLPVLGLLAPALLAACSSVETASECVTDARAAEPAAPSATADPHAEHALPAAPAAPFAVSLDAADKTMVWNVEATHGDLDERFVLTAGAVTGSGSAGKQAIPISISPARFAGDPPLELHIRGAHESTIDLAPGTSVVLHLTGKGFSREGTYRASLVVGGSETRVYAIRIKSTSPHPPLGLRTTELVRTWEDVPPLGRRPRARAVIAVDAAPPGNDPLHVVVKPREPLPAGSQHLPSCGIAAHGIGRANAIAVEIPPLEAGRYEGVIEIQGQPLAVQITLKNPAWIVALVVFLGGIGSIFVRAFARYFTASSQSENAIALLEKKIGRLPVAWDHLRIQNIFRHARGSISWLGMDDVVELLKDATPKDRPELKTIQAALDGSTLPAAIKDDLRSELARALRWSSIADADDIDRRLDQLQTIVKGGAAAWVADLRRHVEDEEKRLAPAMRALAARDHRSAARVHAAFAVFEALTADAARVVACEPTWFTTAPEHAAQLRRIRRSLLVLAHWVTRQDGPADSIRDVLHCMADGAWIARQEGAIPKLAVRPREDIFDTDLRAHREITFEIVRAPEPQDPAPKDPVEHVWACDKWPITWRVNGQVVASPAGPRLTYVFPSWSWIWGGKRRMKVTATIGDGLSVPAWEGEVRREVSRKLSRRTEAEIVNMVVTVLGVGVAAVAAVALYWTGKPFGSWADYMTLLTTGLGVDVGLGTSGKLVSSVVDFLRRKATAPT